MMKSRSHPLLLATLFGLLLAAAALLLAAHPTQAALPAAGDDRGMLAADGATTGDDILWALEERITVTVLTLNLSNEVPGRLIDSLIAQGHGDETLFEVLGYLKAQSGSVISDTFYSDVANLPAGSEVFSVHLSDYAGLGGSVEIAANGSVHIRNIRGSVYAEMPGYESAFSQDRRFSLTYAQDAEYYLYTGSDFSHPPGGPTTVRYDYYAFAIAWDEGDSVFLPLVARNP